MYEVIDNLPIDYDFQDKSKTELKKYGEWFTGNKGNRLDVLISTVRSSDGFSNWTGDYSPESLRLLGNWLEAHIEVEKLPEAEYQKKRRQTPEFIPINDWDLTIKTRSILVDVGIYFGEVFIKNDQNLKWEQFFSTVKKDLAHGHMVIKGFGKQFLSPVNMVFGMGQAIADKRQDGTRLYELYEIWYAKR